MLFIRPLGQLASTFFRLSSSKQSTTHDIIRAPANNSRRFLAASSNSTNNLITIDNSCLNRLKQVLNRPEKEYLRINVETGGCSGFSYVFDIEKEDCIQPNEDLIFERNNYRVVVNKEILPFIKGSTIEYHESLIKSSFQIVNPIAETKCSCGSSFSVDLTKLNQQQSNQK